ncbi:MAG: hypothetical protein ABJN72_16850 [Sulfitobacter sp.]
MAGPLLVDIGVEVLTNMGSHILIEAGKDVKADGFKWLQEGLDTSAIETRFDETFKALPTNEGMLVAFDTFAAPDGSTFAVGPTPYGTGHAPEDPLIDIGFSRKAAAEYGTSIANAQAPAAGWTHTGSRFYWAVKRPAGQVILFRADSDELLRRQFAKTTRAFSLAARAAQGDALTKLTEQSALFDTLENEFREELRSKDLEGRLLSARSKMRKADDLLRRASADRSKALRQAENGKGLQNIIDLFQLGSNMTGFIGAATARADYAASEAHNATQNYNTSVEIYIDILNQTTVNHGLIPASPALPTPLH